MRNLNMWIIRVKTQINCACFSWAGPASGSTIDADHSTNCESSPSSSSSSWMLDKVSAGDAGDVGRDSKSSSSSSSFKMGTPFKHCSWNFWHSQEQLITAFLQVLKSSVHLQKMTSKISLGATWFFVSTVACTSPFCSQPQVWG